MEYTSSTLATELKRQIDTKLPSRPLVGGGMHNFVIKVSVASVVSNEIYFDAIGILLQQLVDDCPEWEIEFEGDLDDMTFTFSR